MAKTQTRTPLDHALEYASQGLPVIPLYQLLDDGTCSCDQPQCTPGKHPRISDWQHKATTDEGTIRKWWGPKRWPNASIGGVGGEFLCLDVDAKSGGIESLNELRRRNTPLPDTPVVETGLYDGKRGLHYWFRVPEGYNPATRVNLRAGIDIRARGGYAVMPPAPHVSGVRYEWVDKLRIKDAAECPEWLLELTDDYITEDSTWTTDPNFQMSREVRDFLSGEYEPDQGEQRDFLIRAARSVLTTGVDVRTAASLLWEGYNSEGGILHCAWNDEWPWTEEEIYWIVSDVFRKPPNTPLRETFDAIFTRDDTGNAQRLLASFDAGEVHYVPELDHWLLWNPEDTRYFVDTDDSHMSRRWIDLTNEMFQQANRATDNDAARALRKHAHDSRSSGSIRAALRVAKIEASHVHEGDLDSNPFLLAVANGVVDLRDGSIREQRADDRITRQSPVEYDPGAKSQLLTDFLERTIPEEVWDYIWRAVGYTLTGITEEHAFFYVYGRPASGKTTFLETLKAMMGTYAMTTDATTFLRAGARSPGGASEDIARLAGPRLVVTTEIDEDDRWSITLISKLIGGDVVSARFLHQGTFEFQPRFKLWIGANNMPKRPGGPRSGLLRRLKIIEMDNVVPREDRDPTLPRRLRDPEALSALLAWAVEGAALWHERYTQRLPLLEPPAISGAVEEYERESDHVRIFIEERLNITGDPRDRVSSHALHTAYMNWAANANRQNTLERKTFSHQIGDRIGQKSRPHRIGDRTRMGWIGLRIERRVEDE